MSDLPDDELMHYGILRKSGRYPWGSGKDEYSRSMTFQDMVSNLKGQGVPEKDIAVAMGLDPKEFSVTQLRDTITIAKETIVAQETERAVTLRDKQYSIAAISKAMGIPESTVSLRLKKSESAKKATLKATADVLRDHVDKNKILDIGKGNNIDMGISPERYRAAVSLLRDEGYKTYNLQTPQPGSRNLTIQKVLVPPGTTFGEASKMRGQVFTAAKWSENEGITYLGIHEPISLNSKRIKMVFREDGGSDRDGVAFVRPDVPDLSMGKNKYAQVRIAIDGTHYFKGMAVVTNDVPHGSDLVIHTNKSAADGIKGALKPLKVVMTGPKDARVPALDKNGKQIIDPENPFGSAIKRQIVTVGKDGKEKNTSVMNLVNEEGDWETWSNSLPSQMLAKQPQTLIRSQLAETVKQKKARVAEIESITNPVLRRKLLEKEADKIDSDAVDLRAASFPGQKTQVIIPVPKMSQHEVYAPRFETGDRVVLIRYPHGGRFEIPEVTVNNNNRAAKALLGNAPDAIGIHPKVAQKLSGADFDGDTVVVIPNSTGRVRGSTTLGRTGYDFEKGLNGFDPQREYGGFVQNIKNGKPEVDSKGNPVGNFKLMRSTGQEMGKITNLITDMSIQGARPDHVVRAVRHSMVVIDAEKHSLDYRRSEVDNGIRQLKHIYQGKETSGATTLLSQATAKDFVPERKLRLAKDGGPIDPATGAPVFVPSGRTVSKFDKKTGTYLPETQPRQQEVKRLALTSDAHTLVSEKNAPVELLYADHANVMKGIANSTRLAASRIPTPKLNGDAKKVYKVEVDDLVHQLREAQRQKPIERHANRIANETIKLRRQEDPSLRFDRDRLNKVERQAKEGAYARLGLSKPEIHISDRAWDAIQNGAVSASVFREILDGNYVKPARLLELALPRKNTVVTGPVLSRAKAMLAAGLTNADIARQLGVAPSTIRTALVKESA